MPDVKIDLTLLNKLVKEVNELHLVASKVKEAEVFSNSDYIVELSKLMGLCSSVALEAGALSQDYMLNIKANSSPSQGTSSVLGLGSGDNLLDDIFGGSPKNKKN